MHGVRKMIEVVTNLAILAVCGLICWTLITHRFVNLRTIFVRGGRKPTWKATYCRPCLVTIGLTTRRLSF